MNAEDLDEYIESRIVEGPPMTQWFPRCVKCYGEWHGLPNPEGCTGAFGTGRAGVAYDEAGRYW